MARRRAKRKVKSSSAKRAGGNNKQVAAINKKLKKALAKHKLLRRVLARKAIEFKRNVKAAETNARAKAIAEVMRNEQKRNAARRKVLAAAELKFAKAYAKKSGKGAKRKSGGKRRSRR